jgi:hypothetical protein
MSNAASTHSDLCGGIDLKVASARFHLDRMGKTLQPPELTGHFVALEAGGSAHGGLRASELCDLQWSQVELPTGRLHVRRATERLTDCPPDAGRRDTRPAAPATRAMPVFARLHDRAGRTVDAEGVLVNDPSTLAAKFCGMSRLLF